MPPNSFQKIIHIDMDCFYAAIEIRDNPALANKPVAVGGAPDKRGVLCTCNYKAREFGVRSAMATAYALRLCPDLIVLPVDMEKYREAANLIHQIFRDFTPLVEPLSLDEAYLDVSNSSFHQGSATLIAQAIRQKIWDTVALTASAGVAPNKFLAKIASGWNKPNGIFVIRPRDVEEFIKKLPLNEIHGVGKVTAEKLHQLGLKTCNDLQKLSLVELSNKFGKLGQQLFDQCRGIDNRRVQPNRIRKSLSVEETFEKDINEVDVGIKILQHLYEELLKRIAAAAPDRSIKNQYIKVKFSNFKQATLERISNKPLFLEYKKLFLEICRRGDFSIRLLGLGVHFVESEKNVYAQQDWLNE